MVELRKKGYFRVVSHALITGLPYGKPSLEMGGICSVLFFFFFFRVGKSLACHSPGKWYSMLPSIRTLQFRNVVTFLP